MKKLVLSIFLALIGLIVIVAVFSSVRRGQALREIEAEWQAEPPSAPVLAETSRLEIIPLYEAETSEDEFISGHGVSYLIRTDSVSILLDAGDNPDGLSTAPSLANLRALGLQPEEVDAIVISHPHPDHVGGFGAWRQNIVSFGEQENVFSGVPMYTPRQMNISEGIPAPEPVLISRDSATTGVISFPELFPFSLISPKTGEQALVVNVAEQGLVLVTGCGHPTIERLVARAETLYGLPVVGVVGGLHLAGVDAAVVNSTIAFLQTRAPALVSLSPHDSGQEEIEAFQSAFPEAYQTIQIGERILFP